MTVLSDRMLQLMDPKDRKSLGKAGRTMAECQAIIEVKLERELQKQIRAMLEQRGIFYIWQRMDKPTTTRRGLPDFFIFPIGRAPLLVEAKVKGGKVSPEQSATFYEISKKTGLPVNVVWSLDHFIKLLDAACGLEALQRVNSHQPME